MVVIAVIFGFVGVMISGMRVQIEEKPVIGVVDADHSDLSNIATSILGEDARIVYNGSSAEEGLERVSKEDGVALLLIPEGFSENIYDAHPGEIEVYWIMRGAGIMDSIPSGTVEMLIRSIDQEISKKLVEDNSSLDPTTTLNPTTRADTTIFKGKEVVGLSPTQIGGLLTSQSITIPIVIMMLIMMAGGSVISSMGLEKENKTLETLLTLPVRRSHIVIGKIVGSAIVGLIMALIYMVGFRYYNGCVSGVRCKSGGFRVDSGCTGLSTGRNLFICSPFSRSFIMHRSRHICQELQKCPDSHLSDNSSRHHSYVHNHV